jgi:hypothetical protein
MRLVYQPIGAADGNDDPLIFEALEPEFAVTGQTP